MFCDKLLSLYIIGAQKGKLGAHFWDVSIAEISSLDLLIVSMSTYYYDAVSDSIK